MQNEINIWLIPLKGIFQVDGGSLASEIIDYLVKSFPHQAKGLARSLMTSLNVYIAPVEKSTITSLENRELCIFIDDSRINYNHIKQVITHSATNDQFIRFIRTLFSNETTTQTLKIKPEDYVHLSKDLREIGERLMDQISTEKELTITHNDILKWMLITA